MNRPVSFIMIGLKISGGMLLAAALCQWAAGEHVYAVFDLLTLGYVCYRVWDREGMRGERFITVQTFNIDFSLTEVITYEVSIDKGEK